MKIVGGYFGLELNPKKEYHSNAIRLNSGRNALEYLLRANVYQKLYLPYYTCDVLLQPLKKLKVDYSFYTIDHKLEPVFDFNCLTTDDAFLYVNYFGLKDEFLTKLDSQKGNLIIDNSQAFYSSPINNIDTFYSPRKFFGVPDGGYLYTKKKLEANKLKKDTSYQRFSHLLKRIDLSPEAGYNDFQTNDKSLDNQDILQMSSLTQKMLQSIDYEQVAKKRKQNFNYIKNELDEHNQLKLEANNQVPLIYPFLSGNSNLRQKLIENRIYPAQYWPNVLSWTDKDSFEHKLATNLVSVPIDQRYGEREMEYIVELIKKHL